MMKVLIVEDEELTATELKNMLHRVDPAIHISAMVSTVSNAVSWLKENSVDLIFMDIHLGDGESFQIFQQTEIKVPVIFTTAYDYYSLKAFKHQGIDYLLKPYDEDDLRGALNKLKDLSGYNSENFSHIATPLPADQRRKERFMVNVGTRLRTIGVNEVAYFMASDKYLYLVTRDGQRYIIEDTITSLEPQLSPRDFFRINRKFIISLFAIAEMYKLSRNRVRIILEPLPEEDMQVAVSEDRAEAFKNWLNL